MTARLMGMTPLAVHGPRRPSKSVVVRSSSEGGVDPDVPKPDVCKTCGVPTSDMPWGCGGDGRVQGGIGAVPGFRYGFDSSSRVPPPLPSLRDGPLLSAPTPHHALTMWSTRIPDSLSYFLIFFLTLSLALRVRSIARWWPIKAYRPCSKAAEKGIEYTRKGQGVDEVMFGRK